MVCQYAALSSTFTRSSATTDGPRDALCNVSYRDTVGRLVVKSHDSPVVV